MIETVEQQRHRLYRAEQEALTEYQLFLETTPLPHDGSPAALYLRQRERLRTNLQRAETARELSDDVNPLTSYQ